MTNASGMHLSPRSYLTAGIAVLGAGVVALAPVQPLPEWAAPLPHRVVSGLETTLLASSFDPITPWIDTITTAIDNIGALIGFAFEKPFPILQTVIANIGTYFGELTSGNAGLIPGQIFGNIEKLFTAPWDPGEVGEAPLGPTGSGNTMPIPAGSYLSDTTPAELGANSPSGLNSALNFLAVIETLDNAACQEDGDCGIWPTLMNTTTLLQSYGTGAVLGLLGPVLSPVAALINSTTAIIDAIQAGDFIGALNGIVNIPANLVNGFLNGALLDLTPIVTALGLDLPVDSIGVRLGGLTTGPMPTNGSLADPNNPPTEFSGGAGLDSLQTVANLSGTVVRFPGLPIGPIGSLIGMGQYLSDQLLVTPPETPAAETAAAVEVEAPAAVAPEAEPREVAKVGEAADPEPAAVSVTAARAEASADTSTESAGEAAAESASQTQASTDEAAPAPTRARANRTAPAAAGGDTDTPAPRAAGASRR